MKTTPNGSIDRIRFLLLDTNPNNRIVSFDVLKRMLDDQAQAFAMELSVNRQSQSISLTAGNYQASLSSTGKQYRIVDRVIDDQRRIVDPVSFDALLAQRYIASSGRPRMYAIEESGTGVVTLDFYPTPDTAYTFTVYYQELPLWLESASTISTGAPMGESILTTGTAWPFDEPTCRALEKSVAMRVLAMIPNEELLKRGLSKDIINLWQRDVEEAKRQSRIRINRQRRTSMIEMANHG